MVVYLHTGCMMSLFVSGPTEVGVKQGFLPRVTLEKIK